jgi:type VI secretion system secreted protein Hcp
MKTTIKNSFAALALPTIAALALLGTTAATDAAAFMKLGDIKGEATDNEHKDWIIIESMSSPIFRAMTTDSATGVQRRRGDVILGDITCTKELDKSSPKIAEAVCNGRIIPSATIEFVRDTESGRATYYRYELTNVLVSSYSVSISSDENGDDVPVEQFSLNFEEIKVTYTEFDSRGKKKGNVEYTWKVEEGEAMAPPVEEPVVIRQEEKALTPERDPNVAVKLAN